MADLTQTISDAAGSPASASGDGGSVTGRSIADLIAADKYLAASAANKRTADRGLRFNKLSPPGTINNVRQDA